MLADDMARYVKKYTLWNGGGTFDNFGNTRMLTKGYAVSCNPELTRVLDMDDFTPTQIAIYFHDMARAGKCIGTWVNDKVVHLDVITIVEDREEALSLAREHCELAVFDFGNMRDIDVED
jgi:hypothetical protein